MNPKGLFKPVIVSIIVSALASCGEGGPHQTLMETRDSLGILIVENSAPLWQTNESAWTLDSIPSLEIGADPDDPGQQLYGVGGVLVLENGRVVVVNEGLVNVLMFDSLGSFLGAVGRPGEGPGEFRRVDGVYRCPGDTIVVNGFSQVSFFDSEATFIRSERLVPTAGDGTSLRLQGVSSDCSRFLLRGGYATPELGEVGRVSYTLFWGTLDNSVRDSISTIPGWEAEVKLISGGAQPLALPWGAGAKWAVRGDEVFLGMSDRPEIRVFDSVGLLTQVIRWPDTPRPVSAADRALYADRRERWLEKYPQVGEAFPDLDEYSTVPTEKPALLSLLTDDEGNLWVREYPASVAGRPDIYDYSNPDAPFRENPAPSQDPERWNVFDSTGRLLGAVEVPADLAVRSIHKNRLIAIWRDEFDVERIRFYHLNKDGARQVRYQPGREAVGLVDTQPG